jgi:allophanate hydrolase subunit 2
MGCRLEGAVVDLKPDAPKSIISEPSVPGGVQIPANGQPIILLVEQTVGGYAKIATVVSADLDKVAQLRPGEKVQFQKIDLDSARNLYKERQQQIQNLKELLSG